MGEEGGRKKDLTNYIFHYHSGISHSIQLKTLKKIMLAEEFKSTYLKGTKVEKQWCIQCPKSFMLAV